MSPILITGGTGRLGSHVVRRRWVEGACDGRAAVGCLQARDKHLANGLAGEPDWAVGLRTWEDFLASPGDRSGPTERPARYGTRQPRHFRPSVTFLRRHVS
jgi:hypothetical protein